MVRLKCFTLLLSAVILVSLSQINCTKEKKEEENTKGIVLGVRCEDEKKKVLTKAAESFDKTIDGKLSKFLNVVKGSLKPGTPRLLYLPKGSKYEAVALVGLPKNGTHVDDLEELDEGKYGVRIAASVGCRTLQASGIRDIYVESFNDPEAAAEGSHLGIWKFEEFKKKVKPLPKIHNFENINQNLWNAGMIKATAQNTARRLMDLPSNKLTPTIFAEEAEKLLKPKSIEVKKYDKSWIEKEKMGSFLSVAKGSVQAPVFLEMKYGNQNGSAPVVLVGKGITFDSGGIGLKPSRSMDEMRADMGGAACVVATMSAIAQLHLPINVVALVPLCENMPGSKALKPGDIVKARNNKTIKVDDTDAEGRLILADALSYASTFKPSLTIDVATLTGAMEYTLGGSATGVFTNSTKQWNLLREAGQHAGDRVWRMPLWEHFEDKISDSTADVNNVGEGDGEGDACIAAAFLKEFAPKGDWIHLDIAGVLGPSPEDHPYLQKGMSGRPTRTLIHFLDLLSHNKTSK